MKKIVIVLFMMTGVSLHSMQRAFQPLLTSHNQRLANDLGIDPADFERQGLGIQGKVFEDLATEGEKLIRDIGKSINEGSKVEAYQSLIDQLEKSPNDPIEYDGKKYFHYQIPELREKQYRAQKARAADNMVEDLGGAVVNLAKASMEELVLEAKHARKLEELAKEKELEGAFSVVRMQTAIKTTLDFFKEPRNLAYLVAATGGIIGSYYVLKHGTRIVAEQIEKRLGKPPIVKETSRLSFWEKLKGKSSVNPLLLEEVIAAPKLRNRLVNIANDTRDAVANGDYFSNLLLYGPPGTGKTMFSKALAYHSGLDYALIPGSSLAKLSTKEALAEFWKLLQWAKHSKKGTVLIFDEADTFLPNRQNAGEGTRKLVTEFLAQVEKPLDKKIMFVLVTNRPNDLDIAVHSRMGDTVRIPRPEKPELKELINLYSGKVLDQMIQLDEGLDTHFDSLAQVAKDANLVGRDIELLFKVNVVREVRRSEEPIATYEIVNRAFENYIESLKEREEFVLKGRNVTGEK